MLMEEIIPKVYSDDLCQLQTRDTSRDVTFTSSQELLQFRNQVARVPGCDSEVAMIDRETGRSGISEQDGDTLIPPVVLEDSRYLLRLVSQQ